MNLDHEIYIVQGITTCVEQQGKPGSSVADRGGRIPAGLGKEMADRFRHSGAAYFFFFFVLSLLCHFLDT